MNANLFLSQQACCYYFNSLHFDYFPVELTVPICPAVSVTMLGPGGAGDSADWELSKENVQPLRQGRRVDVLNTSLQTTGDLEMAQKTAEQRRWVHQPGASLLSHRRSGSQRRLTVCIFTSVFGADRPSNILPAL